LLLLHGFEVGAAAVHAAHTSHAGHTRESHVDDGACEENERRCCGWMLRRMAQWFSCRNQTIDGMGNFWGNAIKGRR
jgi:hypothetical protein